MVLPLTSNNEIDSVINTAIEGSALHKKYGVYLQVVRVATVPEEYESRLTELFPGSCKHLRLQPRIVVAARRLVRQQSLIRSTAREAYQSLLSTA